MQHTDFSPDGQTGSPFITLAELAAEVAKLPPLPPELDYFPAFEELALAEPRLAMLLIEAMGHKRRRGQPFCANEIWYGYGNFWGVGLKQRMLPLVGFGREDRHPLLATTRAYDVAYRTIYEALPDCRCCCCAGGGL